MINIVKEKKLLLPYINAEWRCISSFCYNYLQYKEDLENSKKTKKIKIKKKTIDKCSINKKNEINSSNNFSENNYNNNNINNKMFISKNKFIDFYENFESDKTIILNEVPNRQKLRFIIDNKKQISKMGYEKIVIDAESYKKSIKNNKSHKVEYTYNKGIRYNTKGISSTSMSRNLRNFIFDNVVDFDMKNSQISVFKNLIDIFDLGDFPELNKIYNDKNKYLFENDLTKDDLNAMCNGGKIENDKGQTFCNEIKILYEEFKKLDIFKKLYKKCLNNCDYVNKHKDYKNKKNINTAFLAWVYQSVDSKIILLSYEYSKSKNKNLSSLEYDGFKIFMDCVSDNDDKNFTNFVNEKSGLNIQFINKEMEIDKKLKDFIDENYEEKEKTELLFDNDNFIITFNDLNEGFLFVAEKLFNQLKDKLKCISIKKNKSWIGVKNNLWVELSDPINIISGALHKGFNEYRSCVLEYLKENEKVIDDDEKKNLQKSIESGKKIIDSPSFLNHITKSLSELLKDNEFISKLDRNSYCISFKNGIYDVRSEEFREGILPTDFLSKTLNFDYVHKDKLDQDAILDIKEQFKKICNYDDEQTVYVLTLIGYMLCGDPTAHQLFTFMLGDGGNGKSFIMTLLHKIMPCYVDFVDSKAIESNYEKQHKFYRKFSQVRIAVMNEIRKGKMISCEAVKELADGEVSNKELMYGESETLTLLAKPVLVCNPPLIFDGNDNGRDRRYEHLQHNSKFIDKKELKEDNFDEKEFIMNPDVSKNIIQKHYNEFVHIMMEFMKEYYNNGLKQRPKLYQDEIDKMKSINDTFGTFFKENFEITGKHEDKITKQEMKYLYYEIHKSNISEKDLKSEMDKFKNLTYDKNLRKESYKRGGWRGIKDLPTNEAVEI